jgi:hypothetical protein
MLMMLFSLVSFFTLHGMACAEPVLYFSDITNGPKTGLGDGKGSGVIVTVWGMNLGNTQGSSKVYCNGQESARVYYWGNADGSKAAGPADLYTSHGMQTISFSVASNAANGTGSIFVAINGVNSNTLHFTVRSGDIVHIKTTGSDRSGCGSWSSPCKTLSWIGTHTKVGDTVYVGDGVIHSGSLDIHDTMCTASNSCSIIAYPNSTILIKAGYIRNWNSNNAYWNFSKFTIKTDGDAINTFTGMRAVGNEMTNNVCADGMGGAIWGMNFYCKDAVGGVKALGNYIHDFGCNTTSKFHHVFYITNRGGCPTESYELGWNHLKNNKTPHALHVYDEGKGGGFTGPMKIHDNVVINQVGRCIGIVGGGEAGFHMPIEIYNNLCVNTGLTTPALKYSYPVITWDGAANFSKIKFYNNTIYGFGTKNDGFAIDIPQNKHTNYGAFAGTWEMKNNIFVDTMNRPWEADPTVAPAASSNNIWYSTAGKKTPPRWDTNPSTQNPLFVNPAAGDLHLKAGSSAINAGTTSVSSVVKRDLLGKQRTTTSDIGAIQH